VVKDGEAIAVPSNYYYYYYYLTANEVLSGGSGNDNLYNI
jgi:hypothetical protein